MAVQNTMVTFTSTQTQRFVDVAITNDFLLESSENFQGVLSLPSGSAGVSLGENVATATIQDNDRKSVIQLHPLRSLLILDVIRNYKT